MINLLPQQVKEQIQYAKRNVTMARYMILIILVAILLTLIMFGGMMFAQREISILDDELKDKELLVGDLRSIETEAKRFEQELNTVSNLFDQESRFSGFIAELASVIPPWAKLNSLQLTRPDPPKTTVTIDENGEPVSTTIPSTNDGKTLDISFIIRDASDAAVLRKNLLELPRVEFVDIQNVATIETENSSETTVAIKLALLESPDKPYTTEEEQ